MASWVARGADDVNKLQTILNGVFRRVQKVWGMRVNPVSGVECLRLRVRSHLETFPRERFWRF